MPKRFDLIIFDWDGTLVDSTQLIVNSIRAASADVGLPVPDPAAAKAIIGLGLTEAMDILFGHVSDTQLQQMVARYRLHYFMHDQEVALFDGVFDAVAALAESGRKLAVSYGAHPLENLLVHAPLAHFDNFTKLHQWLIMNV